MLPRLPLPLRIRLRRSPYVGTRFGGWSVARDHGSRVDRRCPYVGYFTTHPRLARVPAVNYLRVGWLLMCQQLRPLDPTEVGFFEREGYLLLRGPAPAARSATVGQLEYYAILTPHVCAAIAQLRRLPPSRAAEVAPAALRAAPADVGPGVWFVGEHTLRARLGGDRHVLRAGDVVVAGDVPVWFARPVLGARLAGSRADGVGRELLQAQQHGARGGPPGEEDALDHANGPGEVELMGRRLADLF